MAPGRTGADSIGAGLRPQPPLQYDEARPANSLPWPAVSTNCRHGAGAPDMVRTYR